MKFHIRTIDTRFRRYGDQRPYFDYYVAVPEEQHLNGIDGKVFPKHLYCVREFSERIGQ